MGTRRRASGRALVASLTLATASLLPCRVRAQGEPPDFTGLTMEQLMEVELVQAAARHPQSLRDAPSAVTVVSAEEIRHQGYRNLSDLLRALPSFYVTYDRNYSYVGVRGFGRPGDYNTRVLVLVNGARLNDNIYDGVYVGNEFLLDMDLVERVEVVRGPAASLYGNSALFAVVNVVTRRGADLQGAEVTADAGSFGTFDARASYGRRTASGLDFLVSASTLESAGRDLFYPEYDQPETGGGWARGVDGEVARKAFASAAWRGLSLHAAHVWRRKEVPTGSFGTSFDDPATRTWDELTQVVLQYDRTLGRATAFGRAQHGRYDYRGHYAYEDLYADSANGAWWIAEAGVTVPAGGRHLLTLGGEAAWNTRQDQGAGYDGHPPQLDIHERNTRTGFYAQDEFRLAASLRADFGLRYDTFGDFGERTSPRLALVYTGRPGTVKALFGSAFRAPNQYEMHYYGETPELRPETIRTFELVWEHSVGRDTRLAVSLFDNTISRLITLTGEEANLSFYNAGDIRSQGFELLGEWRRPSGARGRLSYALQKTREAETGRVLTNSPRHAAKLELEAPLAGKRLWSALNFQYTSSRLTLAGQRVGGFTLANLTLSAPRLVGGLDLSAGLYNLLDSRYADPGSEEHRQDTLAQDGRSFRVKAMWKF